MREHHRQSRFAGSEPLGAPDSAGFAVALAACRPFAAVVEGLCREHRLALWTPDGLQMLNKFKYFWLVRLQCSCYTNY